MKLLFVTLLLSSFAFGMHNPKNMSRENLEKALLEAQQTIARQQETIQLQSDAIKLAHDLYFGTPLEQASARSEVNKLRLLSYSSDINRLYVRK